MDWAKVNSHPLVYTYIIIVTTYKKTTNQQSRERERERDLGSFLIRRERSLCESECWSPRKWFLYAIVGYIFQLHN